MRKYFLFTVVALLTASSSNAEDYLGTIQVNATVKNVTNVICSDLDFGDIYIPANNSTSQLTLSYNTVTNSSITGDNGVFADKASQAICTFQSPVDSANVILPQWVTLTHESDSEAGLLVTNLTSGSQGHDGSGYNLGIGGTLMIPESTPTGEYTGSFTVIINIE